MARSNFMNYLNISFSGLVFLGLGIVIITKTFSSDEFFSGSLESASCVEDEYRVGTYTFTLSILGQGTFRNRLNISCENISDLKTGDQVEIETSGHLLMQLTAKGVTLIEREMVERREAEVNALIYFIFLIAMGDFFYRTFSLYKGRERKKTQNV